MRGRASAERKQWPVDLKNYPSTVDRPAVLEGIHGASLWLQDASEFWTDGGVAARYNLRTGRYQGPYPETTGYLIPTLLRLAEVLDEPSLRARARDAGQWLRARQRDTGAVRCNVDETSADRAEPDKIILFDCGAILQGFSALARHGDPASQDAAIRLSEFLCASQNADGKWTDYLYFPTFGTHNALVAYALIDAADAVGEPKFKDAGLRCLDALRGCILPSGFIKGCEFGANPETLFLHPYCYTLEGYTKSAMVLGTSEYLAIVEGALDAMLAQMNRTGQIPAAYLDLSLAPVRDDTATTGLAQLAQLMFKIGRWAQRDEFLTTAHRIMNFLRERIEPLEGSVGTRGGIQASFPTDGEYGAFTINNWTIKYFLDASMEELAAIEEGQGRDGS